MANSGFTYFSKKHQEVALDAKLIAERISMLTHQPCEIANNYPKSIFVNFPNLKTESELMGVASFLNQAVMANYDCKQLIKLSGIPKEILKALSKLKSLNNIEIVNEPESSAASLYKKLFGK